MKFSALGLSTGEIAVYAYLMYCEDRKTFQCHPSYKTIGNAVGMSKNTVKKYVDSLIEKQLITAEPTSVITRKKEKSATAICAIQSARLRKHWSSITSNS